MRAKRRDFDFKGTHHILVKHPHDLSYAAYIKYKRWLASLEFMTACDRWMQFRYTYLIEQEKAGPLTCVYCGKTNLIIYTSDDWWLATVDHVLPLSRGGERFDTSNLCVACTRCNQKKLSQLPLEFMWEHAPWNFKNQKDNKCTTLKPISASVAIHSS